MMKSSTRDLSERAYMIDDLGGMLASGDNTLAVVPSMFKRIMMEGAWLHFKTKFGNDVTYERTPEGFARFVTTPPLDGLGTTLIHLRQLIAHDTKARALFDELTQRPDGNPTGANQYTDGTVHNMNSSIPRPHGDSQERALRVLRERHPEQYTRVLNGEIKPYRAMVEVGEAPPKTSIRLDDVDSIARTLRKNLTADQIEELVNRLTGDQP